MLLAPHPRRPRHAPQAPEARRPRSGAFTVDGRQEATASLDDRGYLTWAVRAADQLDGATKERCAAWLRTEVAIGLSHEQAYRLLFVDDEFAGR